MSLTPGARLGPYDIVTAIGAGGMGEVYRARDTRLGREVAIKVLPAGVATDLDRLARFEREARAVAALNHPNIVTLHSIEEADGIRFITMELVEGSSLDTFVTAGGLPVPQLYDLAVPLADALAAAHARGVVHRDLKPANVMVTRDGRIKVLDFGLARITEDGRPLDATQAATVATPASSPGQVVGTVPYMSPEQLRGEAVDARSDLFSLGIILYELAAGRRPFAGGNLADVSSAILRDAPARLSEQRADLPADLERIIGRCLEKDPERRIQTAKDVRNELDLARAALVPAPAARRTPPPVPRPPSSTGPSGATSAPGDSPSIAVLPFVNRSGSDEDEYFSDGLADELLGVLAKIKGLRVAARTSSFQFKGKAEDPAEIGRRLKVATLLEGSVRKAGNRVRISVQLVNVADGFHLWSESYDRTLDDIFAVQDDIARSVVQELRAALFGAGPDSRGSGELRAEVAAAGRGRAMDPEVHRLCLQGRYLVERGSIPDLEAGIACLRKALDIEPAYAIAWAVLSRAEGRLVALGQGDVTEVNARARESARRAVELDPELVEGYLAIVYHNVWHEWDWAAAAAAVQRARQLAPQNAEVLRAAGLLAYSFGRVEESIDHLSRAADLDPLNAIGFSILGRSLSAAGRFTEAESVQRTALELSPGAATFRLLLARALEGQGRFDEALAEAVQEPVEWARLTGEAIYCFRLGRTEASDRALHGLLSRHADTAAYQIALVHAVRGEVDLAFDWLDRAYAQRDSGLGVVKPSGYFTTLHGDPRWAALLRRAGLDRE